MTARRCIQSLDDLKARCDVIESGPLKCWLWEFATHRGRPTTQIDGVTITGHRIAAVVLGKDKKREPHQRWSALCNNPLCLAPHHLTLRTHAECHQAASKAGRLRRSILSVERSRAAQLKTGKGYPQWMVDFARASDLSSPAIARQLGVSKSAVKNWRSGKARKPAAVSTAFAALVRFAANAERLTEAA